MHVINWKSLLTGVCDGELTNSSIWPSQSHQLVIALHVGKEKMFLSVPLNTFACTDGIIALWIPLSLLKIPQRQLKKFLVTKSYLLLSFHCTLARKHIQLLVKFFFPLVEILVVAKFPSIYAIKQKNSIQSCTSLLSKTLFNMVFKALKAKQIKQWLQKIIMHKDTWDSRMINSFWIIFLFPDSIYTLTGTKVATVEKFNGNQNNTPLRLTINKFSKEQTMGMITRLSFGAGPEQP